MSRSIPSRVIEPPSFDFLAGGGEMGERIRGFDWLSTALGSISEWPPSMRLAVGLCLKSRFPIIIHWGWPALTVLYNDAFIPFAGEKHPDLLGRPLFGAWPELQPTLGPMLESVLTTGNAALSDDLLLVYNRSGYLEETYYTLSFNPILLESGRVGGSFSLIDYTTDRVIGERRLRTLRDLASRIGEAKQVEESYRIAAEVMSTNSQDIPFALLYMMDENRKQARLVGNAGLEKGGAASPSVVDLRAQEQNPFVWPLGRVAGTGLTERVDSLEEKFGPLPGGAWPVSPQTALMLPITVPGHELASGILVAAVNPRKALDDSYQGFFDSMARQVAASLAGVLAYQGLVELDRAKTTFFSNVSHEFRTPLTLLIGPLQGLLVSSGSSMPSEDRSALELAVRNGLRLQKLVNSLLDFSRIEAHRVQAVYQATDLGALTTSLASVFRSAIEKGGLRMIVDCPHLSELVYVDHDMWEKIVFNLLSNAFKYTFQGEIRIGLRLAGDAIMLSVSDTGVGIPDEELPRIFERFHRIEGTHGRTYEGTGIGLALVQELVKLHGGSVRVESAVGQGSTFTVTIPRGMAHLPTGRIQAARSLASTAVAAEVYAEEASRWLPDESDTVVHAGTLPKARVAPAPRTKSMAKHELIVVADDNADMRQYFRHLLDDYYEVHAVADGQEALETTRHLRPSLVLADVMMPRLDGFGLLRAIRDDSALASTPVILVSARAGEESRVEGLEAGADDYLVKPFAARELLARVEAHIKMAHLRRETAEREERLRGEAELERQKLHASEERLAETNRLYRELQNREAKIQRLVDANIVGVLIWDLEGRILEANDAFLRIVGYEREDLLSGRLRWTDLTPPEWLERDERLWVPQLKTTGSLQPFEKEYFRKDGSRVPVLVGAASFEASVNQGVAFVLDLTEQKRAEVQIRALKDRLHRENLMLRDEVDRTSMFEEIVGTSKPLQAVVSRIAKVAPTDSSVLITGETGTGKELFARAIHKRSRRAERAFVSVNCAALAPSLISSELFGHEKGAFTGATQRRLGRFEMADGGTIFLDEVGELPPETQVALLRVLQERQFERVGATQSMHVDVRVVAATNRDLKAATANGTFRPDLYYRLNVFPIEAPPLRERKDDIRILLEYFVKRYADRAGKNILSIDKNTLELFQSYHWPGNIRELQNVVERSVILTSGDTLSVDESWLSKESSQASHPNQVSGTRRDEEREEREIIETALRNCRGRVAGPKGAAEKLGIPPSTLDYRIKTLKIRKSQFKFG